MTKKEYLTGVLRGAGVKGTIYGSLKEMAADGGSHYAGILRGTDKPVRAKSKRTYVDKEGVTMAREKLYDVETVYTIVIAAQDEAGLEKLVEAFLRSITPGYDDGAGNWVSVELGAVDWVDEKDSILKAKLAVEIPVTIRYGLYDDVRLARMEGTPGIQAEREEG